MKICVSTCAGGHLDQMENVISSLNNDMEFSIVTVYSELTKKIDWVDNIYYITERFDISPLFLSHIFYYPYLLIHSLLVITKEKPDVLIANGGEITPTLFYMAKLFEIETIYLESLTRTKELSTTGKLVYPITDKFLVQWEELEEKYDRAEYWGKVI